MPAGEFSNLTADGKLVYFFWHEDCDGCCAKKKTDSHKKYYPLAPLISAPSRKYLQLYLSIMCEASGSHFNGPSTPIPHIMYTATQFNVDRNFQLVLRET